MHNCDPVILVPGLTASYLMDHYPLPPEETWSERTFLGAVVGVRREFERLSIHPDSPFLYPDKQRYEVRQPSRMMVGQVFQVAYRELIEELREELPERRQGPVPVFPFSYDWRQPLYQVEENLKVFIDEVIDRTRLLGRNQPHYSGCNSVNLIGHSMGGLVISGYLANCKENGYESRVNRIATLATPFQGSYDIITKVATGKGNLGSGSSSPRERKAARLTPSLYHLLPSFEGALQLDEGITANPKNWFNPAVWQGSITQSIADYIGEHALDPGDDEAQQNVAADLFQSFLSYGYAHRRKINSLQLDEIGMRQDQWLCIVGVDSDTRVNLPIIENERGELIFLIQREGRRNQWNAGDTSERYLTGDGTVPLHGAIPKFLDKERLICVRPDDFEGEFGDAVLSWMAGFHEMMPNMNLVQRLIVRHFTQKSDRYNCSWGRGLPGIEGENWKPPMELEERP